MSQNEASLNSSKRNVIRANQAQLSILKTAFAVSEIISPDALQDIAAQTGLPPKWIHGWFGRQRHKLRNSSSKARSTSAVALSPAEIASIKSEMGDPRSSPFSDASAFDKSNEMTPAFPLSSSSSGVKTTFAFVPATFVTPQTTSHSQPSGMVPETPSSDDLRYTPPPNGYTSHDSTHTLAKSWNEKHFVMNIAPPKRSPMQSTARGINHAAQRRPSNLVNDFSGSIYSSFASASHFSMPIVDSSSKTARRLPGSGLRAVPHEETENVPLVPSTQTLDFARAHVERAFPWTADLSSSQPGLVDASSLKDLPSNQNAVQIANSAYEQPRGASWTNAPVPHSTVERFVDPTKAPLKHLTELLSDFKDKDGGYSRLLAVEDDAKLRKILLEGISVDEDPFLAAMALSLLAGLGFKWE